ncbi:efflux RND transporter permease subunit [Luminiphilus sp.]|nr:efflux RND transporter permease subunit [Luminiphilus sp.]
MSKSSLTEFALANPLFVWVVVLTCLFAGLAGGQRIAQLEDPPYPIKIAYVFTEYPGASALDVEQEITEVLERSIQELPWIEEIVSRSLPGRSEIQIELDHSVSADDTEQLWDELRRRVAEAAMRLPANAHPPWIEDDFSDVYGLLYGWVIPEGYHIATLRDAARLLETEIKRVEYVAKVQVEGVPEEQVYVDFDYAQLRQLGVPFPRIVEAINSVSGLFPASMMESGEYRLRIDVPLERSEAVLEDLLIALPGETSMIRLGDIATISRTESRVPSLIVRHGGQRIFALGIAVDETQNVVRVGQVVEERLSELQQLLPIGIEMIPLFEQHQLVDRAISQFLVSLIASITTVIMALCLFMGWRAGVMVGAVLMLTVTGTIGIMAALGIELQRISLGAMMIAMGMLVDNAIVVTEGMITRIKQGETPRESAVSAVANTRFPLLAATIIGVAAFAPIGLSADSTGEYLGSLFKVCGISLLLSWVLAITLAPSIGVRLLKPEAEAQDEEQVYAGPVFTAYRKLMNLSISRRGWTTFSLISIILISMFGFTQLRQGFFPTTSTPLFFVDLFQAQGTDIRASDELADRVRDRLSTLEGVTEISTWAGRGPIRFTMILLPERPDPAYAQLVVNVDNTDAVQGLMVAANQLIAAEFPETHHMVRRLEFTEGTASKIEARFYGLDRTVLRSLADRAMQLYVNHGLVDRKIDWREQRLSLRIVPDEARARRAGIQLPDVARALASSTIGTTVGVLRDADKPVPIVARIMPLAETAETLLERDLWSESTQSFVSARQIVSSAALHAEDSFIMRQNRVRRITVQGNAPPGQTANSAFNAIRAEIEAIPLPPGYELQWGGEHEAMTEASESVFSRFPFALLAMIIATLILFGSVRKMLVIWMTVPLIVVGVFVGLFVTNLSFTFPAMLGLLSLVGILIKNCVIMVEEINLRSAKDGLSQHALVAACVSRLRPVLLAAGTTIIGMAPLLRDDFFREMAVTIMGGLAFGSVLALLAVPVFYALLYSIGGRSKSLQSSH